MCRFGMKGNFLNANIFEMRETPLVKSTEKFMAGEAAVTQSELENDAKWQLITLADAPASPNMPLTSS